MARERKLPLPKAGIAPNGIKYAIKYDRDWQEWQVRAYKRSPKTGAWKFAEGPTHYTEDRDDAIRTFHHLVGYGPGYERANPVKLHFPLNKKIRGWDDALCAYNLQKEALHYLSVGMRGAAAARARDAKVHERKARMLGYPVNGERANPRHKSILARIGGKLYRVRIKPRR